MSAPPSAGAGAKERVASAAAQLVLKDIPDKTMATIQEAFASFAHSGTITQTDLAPCLRVLGYPVNDIQAKAAFDELAPSGAMEFPGNFTPSSIATLINIIQTHAKASAAFVTLLGRMMSAVDTPEGMIRAFTTFDDVKSGYVTTGVFRSIMTKLGTEPLAAPVVDDLIAYADPDDTGQVEYETFVRKLFKEVEDRKAGHAKPSTAKGKGGKK